MHEFTEFKPLNISFMKIYIMLNLYAWFIRLTWIFEILYNRSADSLTVRSIANRSIVDTCPIFLRMLFVWGLSVSSIWRYQTFAFGGFFCLKFWSNNTFPYDLRKEKGFLERKYSIGLSLISISNIFVVSRNSISTEFLPKQTNLYKIYRLSILN